MSTDILTPVQPIAVLPQPAASLLRAGDLAHDFGQPVSRRGGEGLPIGCRRGIVGSTRGATSDRHGKARPALHSPATPAGGAAGPRRGRLPALRRTRGSAAVRCRPRCTRRCRRSARRGQPSPRHPRGSRIGTACRCRAPGRDRGARGERNRSCSVRRGHRRHRSGVRCRDLPAAAKRAASSSAARGIGQPARVQRGAFVEPRIAPVGVEESDRLLHVDGDARRRRRVHEAAGGLAAQAVILDGLSPGSSHSRRDLRGEMQHRHRSHPGPRAGAPVSKRFTSTGSPPSARTRSALPGPRAPHAPHARRQPRRAPWVVPARRWRRRRNTRIPSRVARGSRMEQARWSRLRRRCRSASPLSGCGSTHAARRRGLRSPRGSFARLNCAAARGRSPSFLWPRPEIP